MGSVKYGLAAVAIAAVLFVSADCFAQGVCAGGCNVATRADTQLVRASAAVPSADLQSLRRLDAAGEFNTQAILQARREFIPNPVLGSGPIGAAFGTAKRQAQINELQVDAAVTDARLQAMEAAVASSTSNLSPELRLTTSATKEKVLKLYIRRE